MSEGSNLRRGEVIATLENDDTTMGTLGDQIGRRWLLMIGATSFGLASMVAAFDQRRDADCDPRIAQTRGGNPGTVATSVGRAVGPLIGGVVLEHIPWGAVSLLGVPVMLLLALGRCSCRSTAIPTPAGRT